MDAASAKGLSDEKEKLVWQAFGSGVSLSNARTLSWPPKTAQ
jgi:hypothetical protein